MSLSIFQSFLSTTSLHSGSLGLPELIYNELTDIQGLSLPHPTPISILSPVHTFDRRREGDTRPANSRVHKGTRTRSIVVTTSRSDDTVEVAVVETHILHTTVLSQTTVSAVSDYSPPSVEPPFEVQPTPQPPAIFPGMLPCILFSLSSSRNSPREESRRPIALR